VPELLRVGVAGCLIWDGMRGAIYHDVVTKVAGMAVRRYVQRSEIPFLIA
jgi:hypothetical protein